MKSITMTKQTLLRVFAGSFASLMLLALTLAPLAPVRAGWNSLTGTLPEHVNFMNILFSPDAQWVVFRANIDRAEVDELYSVPAGGGKLVKLNSPLPERGYVRYAEISPDGSRVLYLADQEAANRVELYSVPIEGGEADKLNETLVAGGRVHSFKIDPGSRRVLYRADQDIDEVNELYSVPLSGGMAVKLNKPLSPGLNVYEYTTDPSSGMALYRAKETPGGPDMLFSAPIMGGGPVANLNQPNTHSVTFFEVMPLSPFVVFMAKENGSNFTELFINYTGGGALKKRSIALEAGQNVIGFRISPDGGQIVYNVAAGNQITYGDLWRTWPDSGPSLPLTEGTAARYGIYPFGFQFTGNSQRVVYLYQKDGSSPRILQSVRADGADLDRADLQIPARGHVVAGFRLSPDGKWVVFEDYEAATLERTLFAVPADGGSQVPFGKSSAYQISPDSQRVVFQRYSPGDNNLDLLSALLSGGELRNLSRMESGESAYYPMFNADGRWMAFIAIVNAGRGRELRLSDGSEPLPVTPSPTGGPMEGPTATHAVTPSVPPVTLPPGGAPERHTFFPFLVK